MELKELIIDLVMNTNNTKILEYICKMLMYANSRWN